MPPGSQPRLRQAIEAAFEKAEASCFESAGDGPNGTTAWYVTRVGPVTIDGQVVAAMIIATDISERRSMELDLRCVAAPAAKLAERPRARAKADRL